MRRIFLVLLAMVWLVGGCSERKVYYKPDTTFKEMKKDAYRCKIIAYDAWVKERLSREEYLNRYRQCMEEQGYFLKDRSSAYPEVYGAGGHLERKR